MSLFLCMVVRYCSNFVLLHVAVPFSQHHLLKRLSFLRCIFLPPLSYIRWPWVHGLSLGFLLCTIDLHFCFSASTILSWFLLLWNIVWSHGTWSIQLHLSFSVFFWLFKVFCVSIQIFKLFVSVLWKHGGNLTRITLNL